LRIIIPLQVFVLTLIMGMTSSPASAQDIGISVSIAPPPLQVYVQPDCPIDGYLWNPGYWAYDGNAYYWVAGEWVQPPSFGLLWTPGYWAFEGGGYGWHNGYWGSQVGFYGGVNYGNGYYGSGFNGGRWSGNSFRYNTAAFNVNKAVIHDTYADRTGIKRTNASRTSFNGVGGVRATPTAKQRAAMGTAHVQPAAQQTSQPRTITQPGSQSSSANQGQAALDNAQNINAEKHNAETQQFRNNEQPAKTVAPQVIPHTPSQQATPRPASPDQNVKPHATAEKPSAPAAAPKQEKTSEPQHSESHEGGQQGGAPGGGGQQGGQPGR
jgi:hypothetical protein